MQENLWDGHLNLEETGISLSTNRYKLQTLQPTDRSSGIGHIDNSSKQTRQSSTSLPVILVNLRR